jgi:hypothetical protein
MSKIRLLEVSEPATPPSGKADVYVDIDDKKIKMKDDAGHVRDLTASQTDELIWTIGDGQNTILSGTKGRRFIPRNLLVTAWRLYEASASPIAGSVVVDLRKGTDFNTAVSIAGTEKPTLSAQDNASDTDLSTWDADLTSGDFIWFTVESVSAVKKIILVLEVEKV